MGVRMPGHGSMLPLLLFGLLQIPTAYCDSSQVSRTARPVPDPDFWELVPIRHQRHAPYSSTVRLRAYNFTTLVNREVCDGVCRWSSCTGTVIAWNIVLTSAHCVRNRKGGGYPWEYLEMWPGGLINPQWGKDEWEDGEAPMAFGSYIAYVEEDVFVHPDYISTQKAWQPYDIAVIVLENPIQRAPWSQVFDTKDASMQLSMLESFIPTYDDPEYPADPLPSFSADDLSLYHFPTSYSMWMESWGRMHDSFGHDIEIVEGTKGMAQHKLQVFAGSSGASIQVRDETSDALGGSASGARIRVLHKAHAKERGAGGIVASGTIVKTGILLGPNHLRWIAGIMNEHRPLVSDLDSFLAPGLETQVCMCLCDDGHITVKVVGNPFDTNCICATGCSRSDAYDIVD